MYVLTIGKVFWMESGGTCQCYLSEPVSAYQRHAGRGGQRSGGQTGERSVWPLTAACCRRHTADELTSRHTATPSDLMTEATHTNITFPHFNLYTEPIFKFQIQAPVPAKLILISGSRWSCRTGPFTCAEQSPLLVIVLNNRDCKLLIWEQDDDNDQSWEDDSDCRGWETARTHAHTHTHTYARTHTHTHTVQVYSLHS